MHFFTILVSLTVYLLIISLTNELNKQEQEQQEQKKKEERVSV